MVGIEPTTGGLQNRCSTAELHRHSYNITRLSRVHGRRLQVLAADLLQGLENDIHKTPEKLAGQMASLAHNIRDLVIATFEDGTVSSHLQNLYETFKRERLPGLAIDDFADMYAQTIVYGLFVAYYNHNASCSRRGGDNELFQINPATRADKSAVGAVNRPLRDFSATNPFLYDLFATITEPQIGNEAFGCLIDELINLLTGTSFSGLPGTSGQHSRQQDSLIHFYEIFLEQYNPGLRGRRGVYYTPQPVFSYIVR